MFHKRDPERIKILRGQILSIIHMAAAGEALNPDDPYGMSRDVLVMTLEQLSSMPSNEDLNNAVRYLEAKGYLQVDWSRDGTGSFTAVRLSVAGVDLVERTTNDPAVKFTLRR
jgi:hypothetical protein